MQKSVADKDAEKRLSRLMLPSLSSFIALLLFFVDGGIPVATTFSQHADIWLLLFPALLATAGTGLAFAFHGVIAQSPAYRFLGIKGGSLAIVGFLGTLFLAGGENLAVFVPLFSAIAGIGIGYLGIGWSFDLVAMDSYRMLKMLAWAILWGVVIKISLLFLKGIALMGAVTVLMAVSSLTQLKRDERHSSGTNRHESAEDIIRGMIDRNWVIFGCLVLCVSINTFSWGQLLAGASPGDILGSFGQLHSALGSCLAAVITLMLLRNGSLDRIKSLTPAIPLLCLTANLFTWFIVGWNEGLGSMLGLSTDMSISVSNAPVGFSVMLICVFLVFRLSTEVQNGLSPSFVFGLFIFLIPIFYLFFAYLQYLAGVVFGTVIMNTLTIACLAASIAYLMRLTQNRIVPISEVASDEHINKIGEKYGLSKREQEIMKLLVQGRSAAYIAEAEFISFNTVRTHIKRIYMKMNVHKKEELLDIVYEGSKGAEK